MMASLNNDNGMMDTSFDQQQQDLLRVFQRDLNILQDVSSTRIEKKKALARLQEKINSSQLSVRQTASNNNSAHSFYSNSSFLESGLLKILVQLINDKFEHCREISTNILLTFANQIEYPSSQTLAIILPDATARLSELEIVEPSEENRLLVVKLVSILTLKSEDKIAAHVEQIVSMLRRTLVDPYPEIRKESCQTLIHLAKNAPKALSYYGAEIPKLLLPALQHRHSAVRIKALYALYDVIMVDLTGLDDMLPHLFNICRDKSNLAREALYLNVKNWCLTLVDRYSVAHKLIPILLTGYYDEVAEFRQLARSCLNEVGKLYEEEWIGNVKKELDLVPLSGQPEDKPRIGTKHLCKENTLKMVDLCLKMLESWTLEEKAHGLRIIRVLVEHIGNLITGYLTKAIPSLCKVCVSEEPTLLIEVHHVAKAIGFTVEPEAYFTCIQNDLQLLEGVTWHTRKGSLMLIRSLIEGTPNSKFGEENSVTLDLISELLCQKEFLLTEDPEHWQLVFDVTKLVVSKCHEAYKTAGQTKIEAFDKLFNVMIHLKSTSLEIPELNEKIDPVVQSLTECYCLVLTEQLFHRYLMYYCTRFGKTYSSWTKYSIEHKLFSTICVQSGKLIGSNLESIQKVIKLIELTTKDTAEYEIRENSFSLFYHLIQNLRHTLDSETLFTSLYQDVILQVILPNLVWKGGKKAMSVRNLGLKCLFSLVKYYQDDDGLKNSTVSVPLIKSVTGLLDEDVLESRQVAIQILKITLDNLYSVYDGELIRMVYPELLKRLDDAHNDVRMLGANALVSLVQCIDKIKLQDNSDWALGDDLWRFILDGFILHMDDTDQQVQNHVCESLEEMTQYECIPRQIFLESLDKSKAKHRTMIYLNRILSKF